MATTNDGSGDVLRGMSLERARALVERRLRAGGSVAEAAYLLGVTIEQLEALMVRVGADADDSAVRLPRSEPFARWFAKAS